MPKLGKWVRSSKMFHLLRHWMATHSLPGFYGIPILDILAFIRRELRKESIILRSNAMAFSFFMALFPSIIVLFTLIAYLPIEGLLQTLQNTLLEVMPSDSAGYLVDVIEELTSIPRGGLLSLSLLLTVFFASNGMISMLRGFEKRYEISYRARTGLRRRLVALKLTFILGILLLSSLVAIVLGRSLMEAFFSSFAADQNTYLLILGLRWLAILIVFYSGISVIYRYGPALKERMQFFTPGTTLATSLSLISSLVFSYYVNNFGTYNQFYGSLGAIVVLMLWLQINSMIILIGYELNASIVVTRAMRESNG